jgi:hypothetical protein
MFRRVRRLAMESLSAACRSSALVLFFPAPWAASWPTGDTWFKHQKQNNDFPVPFFLLHNTGVKKIQDFLILKLCEVNLCYNEHERIRLPIQTRNLPK